MPFIQHIETLVPESSYTQEFACDVMRSWVTEKKSVRYIDKIYQHSGIEKRHSVVKDFGKEGSDYLSIYRLNDALHEPSTGERNATYAVESKLLVEKVSRRALDNCPDVSAEEITHVITVSCTGFYNPGPDLAVVNALNLPPSVQRFNLGFMGCYAAFPALKMADQFCKANPDATVLIVCVELCSLHLQGKEDLDTLVANSVFADGAAAVLINNRDPLPGRRALDLKNFACSLAQEGEEDMAWDIGDKGFNIVLSKYVAKIIGAGIEKIITEILSGCELSLQDIDTWAVHPGGRAILDKIEQSLPMKPGQLDASRNILSQYGNMSSPTILFILAEIMGSPRTSDGDKICAMAFGPGLTIETSTMHAVIS